MTEQRPVTAWADGADICMMCGAGDFNVVADHTEWNPYDGCWSFWHYCEPCDCWTEHLTDDKEPY